MATASDVGEFFENLQRGGVNLLSPSTYSSADSGGISATDWALWSSRVYAWYGENKSLAMLTVLCLIALVVVGALAVVNVVAKG